MLASKLHLEGRPELPCAQDLPVHRAVFVVQILYAPVSLRREAITLHRAECLRNAFGNIDAAVVGHDAPPAWDKINEPLEGSLDGIKIGIDVGVVELDMSENQRVRKVVQELGAFVEESRIVLVALHDESARGAQVKAGSEVLRDAADQERRLKGWIGLRGRL